MRQDIYGSCTSDVATGTSSPATPVFSWPDVTGSQAKENRRRAEWLRSAVAECGPVAVLDRQYERARQASADVINNIEHYVELAIAFDPSALLAGRSPNEQVEKAKEIYAYRPFHAVCQARAEAARCAEINIRARLRALIQGSNTPRPRCLSEEVEGMCQKEAERRANHSVVEARS